MANPCLRWRLLLQFDGKSAARYYAIEPSTFRPTFSLKFYDKGKTAFYCDGSWVRSAHRCNWIKPRPVINYLLEASMRQTLSTYLDDMPHTRLTLTKWFTNVKVNLKRLGLYIGAKMQLVSYEFEYFYQCIMTFWGLKDSRGPIWML